MLDNHGRTVDYLRLAVTDRCNLRCQYCMPAEGLKWLDRKDLLTYEEILQLLDVFYALGIRKLRFTGGEPFLRRDFISLLEEVAAKKWFSEISLTTNGSLTTPFIPRLKKAGIHSVNLSLDTTKPDKFAEITRRDEFAAVMECLHQLIDAGIHTRVNAVIMDGINDDEILPLAMLSKDLPIDVRFIEEMPFNGKDTRHAIRWTHERILQTLQDHFGVLEKIASHPASTSVNYALPGHRGNVGIIAAWSRSFCGSCNRIRMTPQGAIRTCLYGQSALHLRDLLRSGASKEVIKEAILDVVQKRARNGFEAAQQTAASVKHESMAEIGG